MRAMETTPAASLEMDKKNESARSMRIEGMETERPGTLLLAERARQNCARPVRAVKDSQETPLYDGRYESGVCRKDQQYVYFAVSLS